jgi:hypothetical protein
MMQIVHGLRIMPAFVGRLPTETVHVGSFSKNAILAQPLINPHKITT